MRSTLRVLSLVVVMVGMLALPSGAQDHDHGGGPGGADESGTANLKHNSNLPRASAFTQSDLAFTGNLAIAGTYDGFRIIDISNKNKPRQISHMLCNGAQGDVSVYGDLVFRSVDAPQDSTSCNSENLGTGGPGVPGHFEGVQVFDISDPRNPVHINSIYTDCGSHTHTLVPKDGRLFIYVSSYPLGAAGTAAGSPCESLEQNPVSGGHSKISIIEVDLDDPSWTGSTTVHDYFLDDDTEWATYLGAFTFRACHDISVFTELNLAAAACMSESQLWDISNPAEPQFIWRYDNPAIQPANVDLFHSAAFTWDGKVVAFGDESGGGGAARCVDPNDDQGRIWFVDVATGEELASYKIPRSEPGVCTMHNFNFIPQKHGNYTLVSSAYTGGTTVVNVNALLAGASEMEAEIAWRKPEGNSSWSAYWYNGNIYSNDIFRGLDVFSLVGGQFASAQRQTYSNPQTQEHVIH